MPMSAICTPPAAPTILSSANPSCGGGVVLDAGPGYASYLWSTGETTRTITVSPQVTTTYSVVVANATGCRSSASGVQTVDTSLIPPTPTASSNGPICAGQTLQLSASTVAGASYLWSGPGGFVSTQQNPQIVSASVSASGLYQVVAIVNGCASAPTGTSVLVRPDPIADISADSVACFNSIHNAASVPDAGPGATYAWTITNGTILSGAGTSAITFSAPASGAVSLDVTVTDANGCSASGNKSVSTAATCGYDLYSLTPCRVIDTRAANAPALVGGANRTFVLAGHCGIPVGARAVAVNVTVTNPKKKGQLTIYPADIPRPGTSTINYAQGQTRANNTILTLGPAGDVIVHCNQKDGSTVHLIIDVNGYFQP